MRMRFVTCSRAAASCRTRNERIFVPAYRSVTGRIEPILPACRDGDARGAPCGEGKQRGAEADVRCARSPRRSRDRRDRPWSVPLRHPACGHAREDARRRRHHRHLHERTAPHQGNRQAAGEPAVDHASGNCQRCHGRGRTNQSRRSACARDRPYQYRAADHQGARRAGECGDRRHRIRSAVRTAPSAQGAASLLTMRYGA